MQEYPFSPLLYTTDCPLVVFQFAKCKRPDVLLQPIPFFLGRICTLQMCSGMSSLLFCVVVVMPLQVHPISDVGVLKCIQATGPGWIVIASVLFVSGHIVRDFRPVEQSHQS